MPWDYVSLFIYFWRQLNVREKGRKEIRDYFLHNNGTAFICILHVWLFDTQLSHRKPLPPHVRRFLCSTTSLHRKSLVICFLMAEMSQMPSEACQFRLVSCALASLFSLHSSPTLLSSAIRRRCSPLQSSFSMSRRSSFALSLSLSPVVALWILPTATNEEWMKRPVPTTPPRSLLTATKARRERSRLHRLPFMFSF